MIKQSHSDQDKDQIVTSIKKWRLGKDTHTPFKRKHHVDNNRSLKTWTIVKMTKKVISQGACVCVCVCVNVCKENIEIKIKLKLWKLEMLKIIPHHFKKMKRERESSKWTVKPWQLYAESIQNEIKHEKML